MTKTGLAEDGELRQDARPAPARSTELREESVLAPLPSRHDRMSMHNSNKLKIGLFGANCSSGRAVTMIPERWSGGWADCVRLSQMGHRAGHEVLLPRGGWEGY